MHRWIAHFRGSVAAHPVATRWLLAGPGALAAAVLTIAAMPLWLPEGTAGVDNIVYPIILTPLIWAAVFVYACLEENLQRGVMVVAAGIVIQGGAVTVVMAA